VFVDDDDLGMPFEPPPNPVQWRWPVTKSLVALSRTPENDNLVFRPPACDPTTKLIDRGIEMQVGVETSSFGLGFESLCWTTAAASRRWQIGGP
jgi:hypothetical protein